MIDKIIEWCAHNKFLVLVFIVLAVLAGIHAMRNIRLDAIPDLSDTQVIIYSRWDRSPDPAPPSRPRRFPSYHKFATATDRE